MKHQVHFHFGKKLSRRTVLRSAGVAMAIPWLSAMERAFAGQSIRPAAATLRGHDARPRPARRQSLSGSRGARLEAVALSGKPARHPRPVHGRLRVVAPGRFGRPPGRSEPAVGRADGPRPQARTTISMDQLLAKHLGHQTRFPSLVLSSVGQQQPVLHRERLDDSGRKLALATVHAAVHRRLAGRTGEAGPSRPPGSEHHGPRRRRCPVA